jgi:hypothetical protein
MKKFFQRLFCTQAYLDSLTAAELAIKCLDKEALYKYAYAQGRLDQLMGNGPDGFVAVKPLRSNPPPRKTRVNG